MTGDETDDGRENGPERNLGPQPLDAIMREHGLSNHDLVEMRPIDLTHKAVSRARKGRRLTLRMKLRITGVLNAALKKRGVQTVLKQGDLFNY
jgi:hypothetical protein